MAAGGGIKGDLSGSAGRRLSEGMPGRRRASKEIYLLIVNFYQLFHLLNRFSCVSSRQPVRHSSSCVFLYGGENSLRCVMGSKISFYKITL